MKELIYFILNSLSDKSSVIVIQKTLSQWQNFTQELSGSAINSWLNTAFFPYNLQCDICAYLRTVDTKKRRQKKAILRHWLFQASVIKVVQYEVKLVLSLKSCCFYCSNRSWQPYLKCQHILICKSYILEHNGFIRTT